MNKFGRFLQILCLCHGIPERCFVVAGHRLPICARCTGVLIGCILGLFGFIWFKEINWVIEVLLMVPMVVDGYLQYFKNIMSNNKRRFITGLLFGITFIRIFIYPFIIAYNFGKELGISIRS